MAFWLFLAQATPDTSSESSLVFNWEEIYANLLTHGAQILLILVLVFVFSWSFKKILKQLGHGLKPSELVTESEQARRTSTLLGIAGTTGSIVIWLIGGLMILDRLGLNVAPILTGAGVLGFAIGFGAQSLVQDVIAGIFILIDERIRVGDVITVNGFTGVVERMDLRTVTLRDLNGDAHILSLGKIDAVTNMTFQWSRVRLDIGADYTNDPDTVMRVMLDTAQGLMSEETWKGDFLEAPEMLGMNELGDSAIVYRMTMAVRNGRQWAVARELRRRLWYAFDENGLTFPFPQTTINFDPRTPLSVRSASEQGIRFREHVAEDQKTSGSSENN